jgi:type IV secretory pathway VirB10-like protein
VVHRKAFAAPVAVSGGLLLLLLTGACAKPSASPEPVVLPTVSSSVPVTSIPVIANISVLPAATTTTPPPPPPTTVAATTEPPPPPPPAQVEPPPRPTAEPTTTPPRFDQVALEGFPCDEEGATAVDPAGRPLLCEKTRRGRLAWDRA